MVKNSLILIILLFIVSLTLAQSVEVESRENITETVRGEFFYPRFSNSGSSILFTGDGYKGLWIYNTSGTVRKLNDLAGAGNGPLFTRDDQNIIFRSYRFQNMKRISALHSQNLSNGEVSDIVQESKSLYPPLKDQANAVVMLDNGNVKSLSNSLNKSGEINNGLVVYINDSKIVIADDEEVKTLEPLGEGNYIWPSISPDGTRLLFTKAGSGTFVSDLDGVVLYELGKANYPVWAKDGKWVLYMNDEDDGYKFISSEIELINLDTMRRFDLTGTDDIIEMYPDYSLNTDEVVYHTLSGQIIKLKLKFN